MTFRIIKSSDPEWPDILAAEAERERRRWDGYTDCELEGLKALIHDEQIRRAQP